MLDVPFHVILLKGIEFFFLNYNFLNYTCTVLVDWFQQQTAELLIKFKILTSALGFFILKFSGSNDYKK